MKAAMLGVAVLASLASSAHAQVVHFQNMGEFVWQGELGFQPNIGMTLDVTQPPNQARVTSPRTLWYQPGIHTTSGTVAYYYASSQSYHGPTSQARVARNPNAVTIRYNNNAGTYTDNTAAAFFQSGDSVGPSQTFDYRAAMMIGTFASGNQLGLQHAFIGVEFPMADGIHYGYVEMGPDFRKPLSWGYETQPNTPVIIPQVCGTSDFNGDGDFGTDADIEAFFACLAGSCCPACYPGRSDFNNDGDSGTDADIEAFFRVLSGSPCP